VIELRLRKLDAGAQLQDGTLVVVNGVAANGNPKSYYGGVLEYRDSPTHDSPWLPIPVISLEVVMVESAKSASRPNWLERILVWWEGKHG
jgi:hypothetical protein